MATVSERIHDLTVRHAIDLTRFSNGAVRRMLALLNRADAELVAQIQDAIERLPPGSFTTERLEAVLGSIRQINRRAYEDIGRELPELLRDFTDVEVDFQRRLLESLASGDAAAGLRVAAVSPQLVYTTAMARPFSVTKNGAVPLNEYLQGLEAGRAAAIRDAIRLGIVEGEPTASIIRRIRGTRAAGYADGLLEGSRRHIEGMVRTAVNHTANTAQQAMYEANDDIVEQWEFVATLDSRTSITCASLDGNRYDIGKGPVPPRHINCRSATMPVMSNKFLQGFIDQTERASAQGPVSGNTTFGGWLKGQPAAVQDDILGPTRGALFRRGGLTIDKFTDNRGRVYTLDQLRERNAAAFERAGVGA